MNTNPQEEDHVEVRIHVINSPEDLAALFAAWKAGESVVGQEARYGGNWTPFPTITQAHVDDLFADSPAVYDAILAGFQSVDPDFDPTDVTVGDLEQAAKHAKAFVEQLLKRYQGVAVTAYGVTDA